MDSHELLSTVSPNELLLGIADDGLPLKINLAEISQPIFVIAQPESQTHKLLTLAALSCRQGSPSRLLTVVTQNPLAWKDEKPHFATNPSFVGHRITQIIEDTNNNHLLIIEGLEHCGSMPKKAQEQLNHLLKNSHKYPHIQILATINPNKVIGEGIKKIASLRGQLIFGQIRDNNQLLPNEFLADKTGENGGCLKFSLPAA